MKSHRYYMTKMKVVLVLAVIAAVAVARPGDKYTTKYDNIDLDEILNNERLYKRYFNCLANRGKCTPDGKELKEVLPDALETECAKCSDRQRKGSDKVLKFLLEKKAADYDVLEKIYDPTGIYRKKYQTKEE